MNAAMQQPPQTTARAIRRRAGMTMVEILIVIGVIGVLIGIGVIAFSVVAGGAREKTTRIALENCRSMLSEYEATGGGLKGLANPAAPLKRSVSVSQPRHWTDYAGNDSGGADNVSLTRNGTGVVAMANAEKVDGSKDPNLDSLRNDTIRMMGKIFSVPANKDLLGKLSSKDYATYTAPALTVTLADGSNFDLPIVTSQVFLDGWGNPIIFVPGGGLRGAYVYDPNSGSTDHLSAITVIGDSPHSPDGRPFWMSAGPDGNYLTTTDNIYSFDVR